MNLKPTLILALILVSGITNAQQDPHFTNPYLMQEMYNPAEYGNSYKIENYTLGRHQWYNLNGNPITYANRFSMRLDSINSGIGINYMYDQIGNKNSNSVKLGYAYHLKTNNLIYSFGINAGVLRKKLTPTWIYNQPDPAIPNDSNQSKFTSDIGLTIYDPLNDRFRIGIALTHLPGEEFDRLNYNSSKHLFVTGQYGLLVGRLGIINFTTSLYTDFNWSTISTNIEYSMLNKIDLGVGYRFRDAFLANISYKAKFLQFGYAYDLTVSKLIKYHNGSHELYIRYFLN